MKRITLIILAVAAIIAGSVSCQKVNDIDNNPLSTMALSIIPDNSDGSVYSYSDDGSFFLRVSVTPAKYIDKLLNSDGLVCKADFRSVITKANAENPDFTVVGEITSSFVEGGYMTVYFDLAEDEVAKLQASDYVVSFSIEDTYGVHGASTSYAPMNNPRGGQGGDHQIQPDDPVGTVGMLDGEEGIVVELPAVKEGDGDSGWKADQDYPAKKVVIAINNIGGAWPLYEMYAAYQDKTVWRIPHIEELCGLYNMKDVTWTENGCRWAIGNSSLFLCEGKYISDKYDFDFTMASEFLYGLGFNTNIKRAYFERYFFSSFPYLRLFHDMPQ